jgi:hypothetical protein
MEKVPNGRVRLGFLRSKSFPKPGFRDSRTVNLASKNLDYQSAWIMIGAMETVMTRVQES